MGKPAPPVAYCLSWDDAGRSALYRAPKEDQHPVPPEPRKGPRITDYMSPGSVRMIRGGSSKAVLIGHPLKAMYTFTVAETLGGTSPREAVANGEIVMSHELRRTLRGFKQWLDAIGDDRPFHYLWAAENPCEGAEEEKNGRGERVAGTDNPHIHLLTSWIFEPPRTKATPRNKAERKAEDLAAFLAFTARLERLWGLGFVHVEFIKDPQASAAYLLKAANYVVKVAGKDTPPQPIRGQRYYVSDGIRPVRQSRPVVLAPSTAKKLSVLSRQSGEPLRTDSNRIVFSKYCLNGYGLDPDAFVLSAVAYADAYYLDRTFRPDRLALEVVEKEEEAETLRELEEYYRRRAEEARWDPRTWPLERMVNTTTGELLFDTGEDWITAPEGMAPSMQSRWPLKEDRARIEAFAGLEERLSVLRAWEDRRPPVVPRSASGYPDPTRLLAMAC